MTSNSDSSTVLSGPSTSTATRRLRPLLPLVRKTLLILSASAMLGIAAIGPNAAIAFGPPPPPGPGLGGPPPGFHGGPLPGAGLGSYPRADFGGPPHAGFAGLAARAGRGGPPGLARRGGTSSFHPGNIYGRSGYGGRAAAYAYGAAAGYAYGAASGYPYSASRSYSSDDCYYTYTYSYRLQDYTRVTVCD
jgi:hypothetical protein